MAMKPLNPNREQDRETLWDMIRFDRAQLRTRREQRIEHMKQYLGDQWGNYASPTVALNLAELAINIIVRMLASRSPRAYVTCKSPRNRALVNRFATVLNEDLEAANVAEEASRVVLEAMLMYGVMKVGQKTVDVVDIGGAGVKVGKPFISCVSFDDWFHDTHAARMNNCVYMGEIVEVNAFEGESEWGDLLGDDSHTEFDDTFGGPAKKAGDFVGTYGEDDPRRRFLSVFLPRSGRERLIVEMSASDPSMKPRVREWEGPDNPTGPYHFTSFSDVPDSTVPLPPAMVWNHIVTIINNVYEKLANQALRQKTVLGYAGQVANEAADIAAAMDGDTIRMDNPQLAREFRFGGPEAVNQLFLRESIELFNMLNGNPTVLAGLAQAAETLGQEQMLAGSAAQRPEAMRERFLRSMTAAVRDFGWYIWNDPEIERVVKKPIPNLAGQSIETVFRASDVTIPYDYVKVAIYPYSMSEQTPSVKMRTVMNYIREIYMPLAQVFAQQGHFLDIRGVHAFFGQTLDVENELAMMFRTGQPMEPAGEGGGKSPVTERTYNRNSRGGSKRDEGAARMSALSKIATSQQGSGGGQG